MFKTAGPRHPIHFPTAPLAHWVARLILLVAVALGMGCQSPDSPEDPSSAASPLVASKALFVGQSVPGTMVAGQTYAVSVTMKNTDAVTWTASSNYRLGTQNPQDNTVWVSSNRVLLDPADAIAPSATKTFKFMVTAPSTSGTYDFQWRMVQDGVAWFGDLTTNVPVTVIARIDNAEMVSQNVPATMTVGQPYSVSVTVKNTGNTTWTAAANYRLGTQNPQDNTVWVGSNRVLLDPADAIAPNGTKTFTFTVAAPAAPDTYNFQWRMVRDGVGWFGTVTTNVSVPVVDFLSPAELKDYLTQDVCVDNATGALTAQDPFECPSGTHARDLALDEPVLFLLHDMGRDNYHPLGHQITCSVPFRLADGSIGTLHSFDFVREGDSKSAFREFGIAKGQFASTAPNETADVATATQFPSDGYDVVESNGDFASYIATCDPGNGVKMMSRWIADKTCSVPLDDGQLLWNQGRVDPNGTWWTSGVSLGTLEARTDWKCEAAPWGMPTWSEWTLGDVMYTNGRVLRTLTVNFHSNWGGNEYHMETYQYTREYGRTRWVAYQTSNASPLSWTWCNAPQTWGNLTRTDCRDWAQGTPDSDPQGQHPMQWPVDVRVAKGNRLVNGDFGEGASQYGPWAAVNPGTVSYTTGEETPGASSLRQYNHYLMFSWTGSGDSSVYQDVPRGAGIADGSIMSFGAKLWATTPGTALLRVYQLGASGSVLGFTDSGAGWQNVTTARNRSTGWFSVNHDTVTFRFAIYQGQPNVTYFLDDAFLTQQ